METQEVTERLILNKILYAFKKRWLIIFLITLVFIVLSTILSFFVIKPKYEANTTLFIGKGESNSKDYSQSDVLMYQNLMKTYSRTIKSEDLVNRALSDTNLNLSGRDIIENLNVSSEENTQILEIKYMSTHPSEAKEVVEEITEEFINTSKKLVPNGNIQIIETVKLPESPVSPNKIMNIAKALLFGLSFGIGIVYLLELLDNTFKDKNQVEQELNIPIIGIIPKVKEF